LILFAWNFIAPQRKNGGSGWLQIEWLNYAKRAETSLGRLNKIVMLSEKNISPGMM
jgi:hypothetical protein